MSVRAPQGIVPFIISSVEDLTAKNHCIHHFTLEIFGKILADEQGNISSHETFRREVRWNFRESDAPPTHYRKDLHSGRISLLFYQSSHTLMKMGTYAELSCRIKIESESRLSNGYPESSITEFTRQAKGKIGGIPWLQKVHGVQGGTMATPALVLQSLPATAALHS